MEGENGTMAEEIKCLFLKHRVELTENIVLDDELWNRLRATKVLSAAQRDRIQHNKTHSEQIASLLDFLERRSDEDVLRFRDALCSTNQNHIVTGFLTPSSHNEVPSTKDVPGDSSQTGPANQREKTQATSAKDKRTMREDSKKLLRVNREDIIETLDLDKVVWKELIKAKIITAEKASSIQGNFKMAEDQVAPFLDHLIRRPEDDFIKFCSILKECDQGHIVDDFLTKE